MEKIKKSLRKEDGFTLVELLAVIVILGIILAIAIPAIGTIIQNAKTDADTQEDGLIEDAARLYVTSNNVIIDAAGVTIRVQADLVAENYLENISDDVKGVVTVKKDADKGDMVTYVLERKADEGARDTSLPAPRG